MTSIKRFFNTFAAIIVVVQVAQASGITVVGSLDRTDPSLTTLVGHSDLPVGSTIGSDPLDITVRLPLPGTFTTENALFPDPSMPWWGDPHVGFGMAGFDPLVYDGQTAFIYEFQLYLTGSSTPGATTGPKTIGYQTDSTSGTNNLGTGGWAFGFGGYNFDGLHILVTSPTERGVTSFDFSLGVRSEPSSVPDSGSTLALLTMAVACLCGITRRLRC